MCPRVLGAWRLAAFAISIALTVWLCQQASATILFWVRVIPGDTNNYIYRGNSDGTLIHKIITTANGIQDLIYEPVSQRLYWSEWVGGPYDSVVKSSEIDGSNQTQVFSISRPIQDIAIDPGHGKIYWGDRAAILRANLNGSNIEQVTYFSVDWEPADIALGLAEPEPKIYFVQNFYGWLGRRNLDGTFGENLGQFSNPTNIAVADAINKLYVNEFRYDGKIWRMNRDGSDAQVVITDVYPGALALDAAEGKLFWTQNGSGSIKSASLDGAGTTSPISDPYMSPVILALAPGMLTPPPGDFNGDGAIDAADYVVWRKNAGTLNNYNIWRANFGDTVGRSGSAVNSAETLDAVPESPTVSLLFGVSMCLASSSGHARRRLHHSKDSSAPGLPAAQKFVVPIDHPAPGFYK